jgi:uncharacterized protein (UPF0333 family)
MDYCLSSPLNTIKISKEVAKEYLSEYTNTRNKGTWTIDYSGYGYNVTAQPEKRE